MKNNYYYDLGPVLSHHCFLNFIMTNRGLGKSYGFKTWCIKDSLKEIIINSIKTNTEFIWVRRFTTEIKTLKKSFFEDVKKEFPKSKFTTKGDLKFGEFFVNDKRVGYYIALSTSDYAKSSSFPQVDKIIFDEAFIINKAHHYIQDEPVILNELIETVFRDRENNPDAVQPRGVYILSNNVTFANPYFMFYDIPLFKGRFYKDKQRDILVEQYTGEAFVENKKVSHIGKLTKGTKYYEYAIENQSYKDTNEFVKKRPSNCNFLCAIDYKGKTYGFWLDYRQGELFVNKQYDPYSYAHYSLTKDDMKLNMYLVKNANNTPDIKTIIFMLQNGTLFFEDVKIKSQVYEMLSYFVR